MAMLVGRMDAQIIGRLAVLNRNAELPIEALGTSSGQMVARAVRAAVAVVGVRLVEIVEQNMLLLLAVVAVVRIVAARRGQGWWQIVAVGVRFGGVVLLFEVTIVRRRRMVVGAIHVFN